MGLLHGHRIRSNGGTWEKQRSLPQFDRRSPGSVGSQCALTFAESDAPAGADEGKGENRRFTVLDRRVADAARLSVRVPGRLTIAMQAFPRQLWQRKAAHTFPGQNRAVST